MVDISLDLDKTSPTYRDLLIKDNDLVLTKDADPAGTNNVQQEIVQQLSFSLGEWFLNTTEGLDFYGQILVKNPDQSKVDAIIQNAILAVPGVLHLTSYTVRANPQSRVVTVSFVAETTSGKVDYSGTIPVGGGS